MQAVKLLTFCICIQNTLQNFNTSIESYSTALKYFDSQALLTLKISTCTDSGRHFVNIIDLQKHCRFSFSRHFCVRAKKSRMERATKWEKIVLEAHQLRDWPGIVHNRLMVNYASFLSRDFPVLTLSQWIPGPF